MAGQTVLLVDENRQTVASTLVESGSDGFSGSVDVDRMPRSLRSLFEEFEQVVDQQTFALLDSVEERIDALHLRALFPNEKEYLVENLQIYPRGGVVTFRLAAPAPVEVGQAAGRV